MAGFETHRKINYAILLLLFFISLYYGVEKILEQISWGIIITFFISYIIGTELLSPDLDTKSIPSGRLDFLYWPMRKMFTHRAELHSIFIGWIIQIIYLLVIVVIIYIIFDELGHNLDWLFSQIQMDHIIGFCAGIFASTLAHKLGDRFT